MVQGQSAALDSKAPELDMDSVWGRVQHVVTPPEWQIFEPLIAEIRELKREKNVVILAHNYQPVEIYWGVADYRGDSLQLAEIASTGRFERVLLAGVHFMAETVKILSPDTDVWIPTMEAGCSLADSITAEDVRGLRQKYPRAGVVTYVNTSAAVKAESDITCTSSNVVEVVESMPHEEILVIPDRHLASYVARRTSKAILTWKGQCDVHDIFAVDDVKNLRWMHPDIHVLAHPECREDVQDAADFVGSTSGLAGYVRDKRPNRVALITECTMSANVAAECPDVEFIQPCSLCPHMRKIRLETIRDSLRQERYRVEVSESVIAGARKAIEAMLEVRA